MGHMQVERMQALLGCGTTVMNAIQMAADQDREMDMNFDEDEDLLALAAEVLGKKASRLEFKLGKAREEVEAAEAEEKRMIVALKKAREQVSLIFSPFLTESSCCITWPEYIPVN